MAKGKNNPSPAGDYIDQLHWQAQHHRRIPIRFEPKWKYKIVYRYPPAAGFERTTGLALLVSVIIVAGLLLSSDAMTTGAKIFFSSVIALIFIIVFFAVKDAAEEPDKRSDD